MSLRALTRRHSGLFGLLLALTLAVRVLVPTGYMPMVSGGAPALSLCGGQAAMAMPEMPRGHRGGDPGKPSHADAPCAFASLGLAGTPAVDPILLAVALAFVMALAIGRTAMLVPRASTRLRPPLRAPPALT